MALEKLRLPTKESENVSRMPLLLTMGMTTLLDLTPLLRMSISLGPMRFCSLSFNFCRLGFGGGKRIEMYVPVGTFLEVGSFCDYTNVPTPKIRT